MHHPRIYQYLMTGLLLCMTWFALPAWATETLDVSNMSAEPVSLTTFVALLEDPERNLTLADVQAPAQAARFKTDLPASNPLALGFTRSAYWLRLTLRNSSATPVARMLVVDNPRISHIQAYLADVHGAYQSISTGSDSATPRTYPNRNFVFPLTLPPISEQVVYLRVTSSIGLLVPLQLWSPPAFHTHERNDYMVQAWYFGIASAMILFNLMLFFALRERIYLLYVVFVSCVACTLAIKNGLVGELFSGGTVLDSNVAYYCGASLSLSTLMLFMRRMLRTDQLMPRVDRLLQGLIVLFLLTTVAFAMALPILARAAVMLHLSIVLIVLVVVVACALKRQRSAYFFLAAFALLMLGGTTTPLRAMGIVPTNVFTVDALQLGSALEMLLLAFALADRFNVMRQEKAKAQAELLQAQQQLVDTLQSSERKLEQRVAQRTDELQLLNSKLEVLSLTDSLTGIANRRHFDSILQQEWQRARRLSQPLALAILDVDWFKPYNDHYGHPAGDVCLRQIAQILGATVCRSSDLVARYGGEEFVFITPLTNASGALDIAQKVVQAVTALALPHARSPLGQITVSIGVVSLTPTAESSAEVLLQRADAALYQAKTQGRNRAELAANYSAVDDVCRI
jgi:diguanylate cyclase (GGDEF)-like protein